jgi:N-acetylneuraminate synthase
MTQANENDPTSDDRASVFIIAEAGVNHNGSVDTAKELIHAAAKCGVDAVKFQTFQATSLIARTAPKAAYQVASGPENEGQLEMVRALELPRTAWKELVAHCNAEGVRFLSTPFDAASLRLLVDDLQMPIVKIGSGEISNAPFLLDVARTQLPVILSTGMSTLGDVEEALGIFAWAWTGESGAPGRDSFMRARYTDEGQRSLRAGLTLLQCVTEYPTPFDAVNLRGMDTLRQAFGLPVGFSDHTLGWAVPLAAVARGATVIEKHFTLSQSMEGPDHRASLEPDQMRAMVEAIRQVEACLGSPVKGPSRVEWGNRGVARRGLVAARDLPAGHVIAPADITSKRPANGLAPMDYWDVVGRRLRTALSEESPIQAGALE